MEEKIAKAISGETIETPPKQLKQIFGNTMLPSEEYGSVTLMVNNLRFEITTFRKDIKYLNNRKPIEIEYVNNLISSSITATLEASY